jgi:pimeloyl-ACP methyl ester carboxylesterase
MQGTSKTVSARVVRHRVIERIIALALFALTPASIWWVAQASAHAHATTCPGAAQADASLRQSVVATRSGSIGYYRFGHGQPLLLITGYRATVSEWNSAFLAALAAHHEVIVIDNPGVGLSQSDHVPDTMAGMADAVSGFIDAMQLGKVDVVGWSTGGMVAQQLALSHPHQVKSLVLMSTTPPGQDAVPVSAAVNTTLSGQSPKPFESIIGVLFPPGARPQAIQCFRSEMFAPADYGRVSVDARTAEAQSRAMATWWHDESAAAALEHLAEPTLVVAGDKDEVLAFQNTDALVRMVPHATLNVVSGGGHALMYQDPLGLARTITRFVDGQK